MEKGITIIITSAGRQVYLEKTLMSLRDKFQTNLKTYWYIIDDNPYSAETRSFIENQDFDLIVFNKNNKGLGYSLNRLYRKVKTKYIFHCQDDWEFLRTVEAEDVLKNLRNNEQLVLKRKQDYKYDPRLISNEYYIERYYTFNPHFVLKTTAQHLLPFSQRNSERTVSDIARRKNIKTRIYQYDQSPIVTHLGLKRSMLKF